VSFLELKFPSLPTYSIISCSSIKRSKFETVPLQHDIFGCMINLIMSKDEVRPLLFPNWILIFALFIILNKTTLMQKWFCWLQKAKRNPTAELQLWSVSFRFYDTYILYSLMISGETRINYSKFLPKINDGNRKRVSLQK